MLAALFKHYKINLLLALVLAVTIIARQILIPLTTPISLLALIVIPIGALLSTFFLDFEFLLQAYVYDPASSLGTALRDLIARKNWIGLLSYTTAHQDEIKNPILRSSLFQVVLLILCGYFVVSKAGLFGTSFALGILLQSIYLGWGRRNKDWFWELKMTLSKPIIDGYFIVMGLSLLYLLVI